MSLDETCEIVMQQKGELLKIGSELDLIYKRLEDGGLTLDDALRIIVELTTAIEKVTEMDSKLTSEFTKLLQILGDILVTCKQFDDSQLKTEIINKIQAFVER